MIDMILYLKVSKNDIFRFSLFHFSPPSPKNFNLVLSFLVLNIEKVPFLIIFDLEILSKSNITERERGSRYIMCCLWFVVIKSSQTNK
ncbi:hypothetical protein Bca4012_051763 [Brassica carinata]